MAAGVRAPAPRDPEQEQAIKKIDYVIVILDTSRDEVNIMLSFS